MLKFLRGSRRTALIWWIIIIGTAVTFVIGFSVAPNIGGGQQASATTTLGTVEGHPITYADYERTLNQITTTYRAQNGRDPQGRDLALLREQAWVQVVTEAAILDQAGKLGYGATDDEVLFAVRNSPPPWVRSQEAFLTNGQFDPRKYQQALSDPNVNWAPLEDEIRRMLPGQKLESNLLSTAKFSEPELREAFTDQYDKAAVTVARWNPVGGPIDTTRFTEQAQRAWYEAHKTQFSGPAQSLAVLARVPKTFRPEDQEATLEKAKSIVAQARGGEDFAQLARDQSEDPSGANGGELGQVKLSNIQGELKPRMAAVADSAILDPYLEKGSKYYVLKVTRVPGGTEPTFHVRQILLNVRPSEEARQADMAKLRQLREQATRQGLEPAAAAIGVAAKETGWFGTQTFVPALMTLPQAQQFAMMADKGAVSQVYDLDTDWGLVQVKDREPAGIRRFETVRAEVRGAMEMEVRLTAAMASAERAAQAARAGKPFEEAAKAEGGTVVKTAPFTRMAPDGQVAASPRAIGLAFGLPVGQVGGPVETPNAVLLVRKDAAMPANPASYDSVKAQVSQSLLGARQNRMFQAWLENLRQDAHVVDKRGDVLQPD